MTSKGGEVEELVAALRNDSQMDPLHWKTTKSLLDQLVTKGNKLPNVKFDDDDGDRRVRNLTVLHFAAKLAAPSGVLQKILDIVNVDFCFQPDSNGNNPLHYICQCHGCAHARFRLSRPEGLSRILVLGRAWPQAWSQKNRRGLTPFSSFAVLSEFFYAGVDVAELIAHTTEECPESLYSADDNGNNILHLMRPSEDLETEQTILDAAPNLTSMTNKEGKTPLHVNLEKICPTERVLFLLEHDDGRSLSRRDSSGMTPLLSACCVDSSDETIQLLITHVAKECPESLYSTDDNGNNILHLMRPPEDLEMEQTILDAAPNLTSMTNKEGKTPHHVNLEKLCPMELAIFLLEHDDRRSLGRRDSSGMTPLHTACCVGSSNETIQLLIERYPAGLQVVETKNGCTPLVILLDTNSVYFGHLFTLVRAMLDAAPETVSNWTIMANLRYTM